MFIKPSRFRRSRSRFDDALILVTLVFCSIAIWSFWFGIPITQLFKTRLPSAIPRHFPGHILSSRHFLRARPGEQQLLSQEQSGDPTLDFEDGEFVEEEVDGDDDDEDDEGVESDSHVLGDFDPDRDGEPFTDVGDSYENYFTVYSPTKGDRKYYGIHMDGIVAYNGNLIPHPTRIDMWIAAASHATGTMVETLSCSVGTLNGALICEQSPKPFPIVDGPEGKCEDESLAQFNWYRGPRDLRLFWGPDRPYVLFGSPSSYGCLGQWLQDARELIEPFNIESGTGSNLFLLPTELRRPANFTVTRNSIEKNWFVFWDMKGTAFVHYEIWPERSFAQIDFDGSVGSDLAPKSNQTDRLCLAKHMPIINREPWVEEKLHQATNSLAITLCKRQEPNCHPNVDNTFIMHIFHRQRYHDLHATYQPYVLLFNQTAPFSLYAIAQKSLWIHGRTLLTTKSNSVKYYDHPNGIPQNHSEMFYVTSMAWKKHGQRYHGYLDDPLWLSFGREDSQAGAIDVVAEDIIQSMALC